VFTLISFVLSLGVSLYVFGKEDEMTSKFYGFPIFKIAYMYPLVQFAVGLLICIIAAFVAVPYWIALVLSLIILGASVIGVIATDNARDIVEQTEAESERVTKATKMFNLNIASVLDLCTEPSVKIELEKLAESFRFSDPVSSDATEDIESTIMEKLENLKISISSSDSDENIAKITELKNLLAERNRICKMNKR
jgi:ABC-type transport system involved in multi-copper enzyme maturation permease subunit